MNEPAKAVLTAGYTRCMAKVMISFPDDLLEQLDKEAERLGTTRSGLLQRAARREIGLGVTDSQAIVARLEDLASHWQGPGEAGRLIQKDRERNG